MEELLQDYCAANLAGGGSVLISGLHPMNQGWESEVYSFDLTGTDAEGIQTRKELVLRIYPGTDAAEKSLREFTGMRRLSDSGYPVPEVIALERKDSPFGRPFVVMERVDGNLMWPALSSSRGTERERLTGDFCSLVYGLHSMDWRALEPDMPGAPGEYFFVDDALVSGRSVLEGAGLTGFGPLMDWLEARRDDVPCIRPSPVHLDFHPANVLIRGDGSYAVIDWTQVSVSDFRFDLAWTLLLLETHESAELSDDVMKGYRSLRGDEIDGMEFFGTYACAKRLAGLVISALRGPREFGMRPDALERMREHSDALEGVYGKMLSLSGIEVPEIVEALELLRR